MVEDFENITVTKVYYFMYQNKTDGAADINDQFNTFIVGDMSNVCETGYEALENEK
jgi:hypothetical protein